MFILSEQRISDVAGAFRKYSEFVDLNKERFPQSVFELASSEWYFNPSDHRCPHDAWLESLTIEEPSTGDRHEIRNVNIRVTLLGAYHDGYIEFRYDNVEKYSLEGPIVTKGHCDWIADEFRLSNEGRVVHEIEWATLSETAHWTVEAHNVTYAWHDKKGR
jgi:hypothetical protein